MFYFLEQQPVFPGTSYCIPLICPTEVVLSAGCTLESPGAFQVCYILFELGWGRAQASVLFNITPGDSDIVAGFENHNSLGHKQDWSQNYVVLRLRSEAL